MQLRMTIIDTGSGGPETIDVRAETHHTLGDLLVATGHAPATATVRGETLTPDAPLGLPPLLDGAELIVGATDPAVGEASRAPLRLVSVSGPDAGRTLELTPGRHTIGRGDAATMRVADDALSREHVELTVDGLGPIGAQAHAPGEFVRADSLRPRTEVVDGCGEGRLEGADDALDNLEGVLEVGLSAVPGVGHVEGVAGARAVRDDLALSEGGGVVGAEHADPVGVDAEALGAAAVGFAASSWMSARRA